MSEWEPFQPTAGRANGMVRAIDGIGAGIAIGHARGMRRADRRAMRAALYETAVLAAAGVASGSC